MAAGLPRPFTARIHKSILFFPALIALVVGGSGLTWLFIEGGATTGLILLGIGIAPLVGAILTRSSSTFSVDSKRLVMRTGIISRRQVDMPIGKVETIDVEQGPLGRMLGYGTLVVTGSGGRVQRFKSVATPDQFRETFNRFTEAAA